jgi:hypothetical protein
VFFRYAHVSEATGCEYYKYGASLIQRIANELGWPWAAAKCIDFATTFPYVGFVWDMEARMVYLSGEKCAKFVDRLAPWIKGALVTKEECDIIIGTLNHCALILSDGRSRLPSLYRLSGSFHGCHYKTKHRVSDVVSADINWWRSALGGPICSLRIRDIPPTCAEEIHVDASTSWGLGFVWKGKWLAWKLKEGWKRDGREIGWAETVAVFLAVSAIVAAGVSRSHFTLRSDNSGVCGSFKAGRSRNTAQNDVLRRMVDMLRDHDIVFTVSWIATADNLADAPSRGYLPPVSTLFLHQPAHPRFLKEFVEKAVRAETWGEFAILA